MSHLLVSPEGLSVVLGQAVIVAESWLLQPAAALLTGVRVPALSDLLLLLLAVVLHVLPQAARVSVLLLAAEDLTLVRFLQR